MKVKPQSIMVGALVIACIFALVINPESVADGVRAVFFGIADVVNWPFQFVGELLS